MSKYVIMDTENFVNEAGTTIFRTRVNCNGEELLVSTSGELTDTPDSYWETMVFYRGADGEPDFEKETLAEERYLTSSLEDIFRFSQYGIMDNKSKLEKIHQLVLTMLKLFGDANEIGEILCAISHNDFSGLDKHVH